MPSPTLHPERPERPRSFHSFVLVLHSTPFGAGVSPLTSTLTKNASATPLASALTSIVDSKSRRISTYEKVVGGGTPSASAVCGHQRRLRVPTPVGTVPWFPVAPTRRGSPAAQRSGFGRGSLSLGRRRRHRRRLGRALGGLVFGGSCVGSIHEDVVLGGDFSSGTTFEKSSTGVPPTAALLWTGDLEYIRSGSRLERRPGKHVL